MSNFDKKSLIISSTILGFLFFILLAMSNCGAKKNEPSSDEIQQVLEKEKESAPITFETGWAKVGGYRFLVEIADSDYKRARGLMFRKSLERDRGMLFVFEDERKRAFWMENTLIPLSIAYIDSKGIIVSIHDMQPLDKKVVNSLSGAKYALEVNQGRFKELKIKPGMKLVWGKN